MGNEVVTGYDEEKILMAEANKDIINDVRKSLPFLVIFFLSKKILFLSCFLITGDGVHLHPFYKGNNCLMADDSYLEKFIV